MLLDVELYMKWWKTWKTLPVIAWVRAASLYKQGHFQKACEYYKVGLRNAPNHPAAICAKLDLSRCLQKQGEFQESEAILRGVILSMPSVKEAHLRLALLQMWTGRALEAAWTMRRALRHLQPDPDLVATFTLALIENGGPAYLLKEAQRLLQNISVEHGLHHKLEIAKARLAIINGERDKGRQALAKLATDEPTTLEAIISFAEVLFEENEVTYAREQLRRAMVGAPDHPRVLSLFARSYLKSGMYYSPEFAKQLSIQACQNTCWQSPREMHILAEAYYHLGEKASALLVASKAKQVGSKLLGAYRDVKNLDRLIEDLSSGTGSQAA